ncbi:MAG: pirin family protein [Actinomycetales bacterium]|nr:pirin family protein [Actinomycetales bacterium]
MSGPVSAVDIQPTPAGASRPAPPCLDVGASREEVVGRIRVRRALPRRGRRTVGAWCFADHLGPADVTEESGLDVGPHPHIGLQTVTWLVDGQVLHRDSLGSEQVIAPGQLNLMTSGHAVAHAEEATGHYRGTLEGIQLWVALPETTRHGPAAFEHHPELPRADLDGAVATVLVGDFAGLRSPARHDTPLVGIDLAAHGPVTVGLRPDFEYAVVVLRGTVGVQDRPLVPGTLGYLGRGRPELRLDVREPARLVLLGGEPFDEPIVMWWNYVARSRAEIDAAHASWVGDDDRFGRVASALPRIPARGQTTRRSTEIA